MGRAADGKVGGSPGMPDYGNPKTSAIKHDIERTRDEMEDTVNAIETRLSPARIKEQITNVKEHAVEQFREAKDQVKDEIAHGISETKEKLAHGISETKEKLVHGIDEAKDKFVHSVDDAKFKVKTEIGDARAAMREATVGRVEHMVERASTQVRDTGMTVMDTVKANPIPAALVGFGLAWLLVSARKQHSNGSNRRFDQNTNFRAQRIYGSAYGRYDEDRSDMRGGYDYGYDDVDDARDTRDNRRMGGNIASGARDFAHRASESVSGAAETVRHTADDLVEGARDKIGDVSDRASRLAHDARDRASHLAHDARDRASHWVDEGRTQFVRAERGVENVFQENPLAIGAVAFALGAAVGLALPTTPVEDRMFGEAKDRLLHTAQDAARDALKLAEEKASEALHMAEVKATQALHAGHDDKKNQDNMKPGATQGGERRI